MISEFLTDEKGNILFENNADAVQNPASLTKLMTLYLAFGALRFDQELVVPADVVTRRIPGRVPQASMGLRAGQTVSVADLVLGMIVPSANDAAALIARHMFGEDAVAVLNREAKALGLTHTKFVSPSGLGDGQTTAKDMAILARRLWEDFPQYRSLFSVGSFSFNGKRYKNTNNMLFKNKQVIGLKTGTTKTLSRNLASVLEVEGKIYFGMSLNCPKKEARDTSTLNLLKIARSADRPKEITRPRGLKETPTASEIDDIGKKMGLLDYPMIWTIDSLAAFLDVPQVGGFIGATPITRIITSAQESKTGDIYVPISVQEKNGPALAKRAIENGAVCVLTSNRNLKGDFPILYVPKMLDALTKLADFARARFEGKILGITGSVGKTTTKDMLALCLGFSGSTHFTMANLNSGNANKATVASIPRKAQYSVIELALMDQGAVRRKSMVAKPHVSIITGIGYSHGAHHGDDGPDAILVGKTEIFKGMESGGTAVLPSGDKKFDAMVEIAQNSPGVERIILCGQRAEDTVRLVNYDLHPTYSEVVIDVEGKEYCYIISQPGRHFVINSLLVAGGLLAVGADLHVLGGLSAYAPTGRRVERFRVTLSQDRTIELIDDAYNAAPDSVRALLDILKLRTSAKRKVLVLGNMLELGPDELRHHTELAPDIEAAGIDLLVTVGDLALQVGENVKGMDVLAFETSAQAAKKLPDLLNHLDLVSVKGSNSMELIRVVNALKGTTTKPERQNMNWSIEQES